MLYANDKNLAAGIQQSVLAPSGSGDLLGHLNHQPTRPATSQPSTVHPRQFLDAHTEFAQIGSHESTAQDMTHHTFHIARPHALKSTFDTYPFDRVIHHQEQANQAPQKHDRNRHPSAPRQPIDSHGFLLPSLRRIPHACACTPGKPALKRGK